MSSDGAGVRRSGRLARTIRFVSNALLVLFGLASIGAILPIIPVLGSFGPALLTPFGSWIALFAAGALVILARGWRPRGPASALVMSVIAMFVMASAILVEARQVAVAQAEGIAVSLQQTIFGTGRSHSGAKPAAGHYRTSDNQILPLVIYRPAPRPDRAAAPILVYVHGGGWVGGSERDRSGDMRFFADRGFLVLSVGYTLSTDTLHAWNVAEPQVGCALVRIASAARRLGGDPGRIAVIGESAGGNLALNVTYKAAAGTLHPACAGTMPRIAATIATYPVLDPVRLFHNDDAIAGWFAPMMTTHYTGGTPDQVPARYAAISSFAQIHPAAPPTLLFAGLADHLLPPDIAFAFARRAQAAGVDVRVLAVPHAEHAFDQGDGSIGNQIFRTATLQFLTRHGMAAPDGQTSR